MSQVPDIQECCVELINGEQFRIKLNVDRIYGLYLFDCVCENLGLMEKEFFGLRYIHPKEKQFSWLDLRKSIKYQLKEGPYSFYLAVKFFPPHPSTLADDQTRYLFILYERELILKKKLSCGSMLGQELSACVIQAEFGDFDQLEDGDNYLQGIYLYPGQDENFIHGVMKLHKQLKGVSPTDCETRFLTLVTKIPNYGIDSHEVLQKDSKNGDSIKCLLGIYWNGLIEMYDNDTKSLCSWENLISASFIRKTVKLKIRVSNVGSDTNVYQKYRIVKYRCPTRTSTKRLYKAIVETHTFFRRHAAPSLPNGPTFHSRFRFIGKTFSQSRSSLYSSGSRISDLDSGNSELNDSFNTMESERGKSTFYSSKTNDVKNEKMVRSVTPVKITEKTGTKNGGLLKTAKEYSTTVDVFEIDNKTKPRDGPDKHYKTPVQDPTLCHLIEKYNNRLSISETDDMQATYYY